MNFSSMSGVLSPDFEEGRPYLLLVLAEEDEREYKRLSARLRPENR